MIGQAFEHHAKQLGVAGREKHPGDGIFERLAVLMLTC